MFTDQKEGSAMGNLVTIPAGNTLPTTLQAEIERAAELARNEKAAATRKAYATDFRIFQAWCAERGASPLPAAPEIVAAFLAWGAEHGARASTVGRRVASIRYAHRLAGFEPPTDSEPVKAVVRGIRRTRGVAAVKKAPATSDRVIAMAAAGNGGLMAKRDRALLLLGFAGAFRRSELVALDVQDLVESPEGFRVTIRRGKTDQEGRGATIAIVRGAIACPVRAVKEWLAASGITEGSLFRPINRHGQVGQGRLSAQSVALIVKSHAARLGFDPGAFAGHSLRAGFVTSAAARGASLFKMMDVSRHRSVDTLRGYVRDAELFKDHAGSGLL